MEEFEETETTEADNGLDADEYTSENYWADATVWGIDRPTALEALNDAGGHYATARDILKKQVEA